MKQHETLEWIQIGDIRSEDHEMTLVKNPLFDNDGNFRIKAITVERNEASHSENVIYNIEKGELFLTNTTVDTVLGYSNLKRTGFGGGQDILKFDDSGAVEKTMKLNNQEDLREIINDGVFDYSEMRPTNTWLAYNGFSDKPKESDDQSVFYPEDTPIWAILRNLFTDYNDKPEENPQDTIPLVSPADKTSPEMNF